MVKINERNQGIWKKNAVYKVMLLAVCLFASVATPAAGRDLSRQESDSVSHALATVWGDYIREKTDKDSVAASAEYMQGLQEALKIAAAAGAYYQGIEDGMLIAKRLQRVEQIGGFKVDIPQVAYVLSRIQKGRPSGFNVESAELYMNRLMTRIAEEAKIVADSKKYLEEVAQREGVVRMSSGLLFEVVTEGDGDSPGVDDAVLVKYTGRLIDDTVFSESPEDQSGSVFVVNQTIPGFKEGLQLMKKGGKYRLYISSDLGYGSEGVQGLIPGGAATIFDVELVDLRHAEDFKPQETSQDP